MTNSGARQTAMQTAWQIFVGWLLGLFVVQLLGIFFVRFVHIVRGQVTLQHLFQFSVNEKLFLISLPTAGAAVLLRKRPFIALAMLLSAAAAWMISAV